MKPFALAFLILASGFFSCGKGSVKAGESILTVADFCCDGGDCPTGSVPVHTASTLDKECRVLTPPSGSRHSAGGLVGQSLTTVLRTQ